MPTPSKPAMRAAEKISSEVPIATSDLNYWKGQLAQIIDRETGIKDLVNACQPFLKGTEWLTKEHFDSLKKALRALEGE